jgi:hypothetical protein
LFSTVPGTGESWSSAWRASPRSANGAEVSTRSTNSSGCWSRTNIRIAKIFLHISAGEQIRRFKDRVDNPLKRWKLSYEDFRNRERWADYEIAIEDMMEKTSTKRAPWYLVPTNDKLFGRIAAFTIFIDRLGRRVNLKPRPLDPGIAAKAAQLFDLP